MSSPRLFINNQFFFRRLGEARKFKHKLENYRLGETETVDLVNDVFMVRTKEEVYQLLFSQQSWAQFVEIVYRMIWSNRPLQNKDRQYLVQILLKHKDSKQRIKSMHTYPDIEMSDDQRVLYHALVKYLDHKKLIRFKAMLEKKRPKQIRAFVTIFRRYFDLETLRFCPIIWQDIWIYNYIVYDMKSKNNRLLKEYNKEVIRPMEKLFNQAGNKEE